MPSPNKIVVEGGASKVSADATPAQKCGWGVSTGGMLLYNDNDLEDRNDVDVGGKTIALGWISRGRVAWGRCKHDGAVD